MTRPTLGPRALNRATLARQMLLDRTEMPVAAAVEHLVGLQAQTPHTAYVGLWDRLRGFRPDELSELLAGRDVVRIALMRSTIHLVTAEDALAIRPLIQPVLEQMYVGQHRRRLDGVRIEDVVARGRTFVEAEPRTFKALGDHLLEQWPGVDRLTLEQAVRTRVGLIQVPPRGLWGRSGSVAHTSIEAWLGDRPTKRLGLEGLVRRYLGAFGPASVMDAQTWSGLTRLGDVFERLRPELVTFRDEQGREVFDLPGAPRPDPDLPAPPRFLYDFDNLLLSHADRTRVIPRGLDIRAKAQPNGPVSSFLVDGTVAGTWRIERERDRATLLVTPLVRIQRRDLKALEAEAASLLGFVAAGASHREIRIERAS